MDRRFKGRWKLLVGFKNDKNFNINQILYIILKLAEVLGQAMLYVSLSLRFL